MDQQKKSSQQTPPFEPGKKPAGGGAVAGKYGMSYSRVRHLARMAMKKQTKEDVNELSNELLQRYKKEAGKQVDNPATPSSMKYKRGLGHLMATVKQMKSGKPMPKEEINIAVEAASDTYFRAAALADKLRKKDPEKSKVYRNLAIKSARRSTNPTGVSHTPQLYGMGNKAKRRQGIEPVPSSMSLTKMSDPSFYKMRKEQEETNMDEMSKAQMKKREEVVKSMKKNFADFRKRYGEKAKSVMYATATKQAMKEEEEVDSSEGEHLCAKHVYSQVHGEGVVLEGQHAEPDENGNIEWYMVEFAAGPRKVFTEKLKVMHAEMHGNHKKKKMSEMSSKMKMKLGLYNKEEVKEDQHYCAKHVYSELFGEGVVLNAQHAEPDAEGNIEWYMVEFVDGIRKVQTEDIEIMVAEYHMNHKKKMKDEEVEFEAPNTIKKEGLPHFMGAAAAAHKAGKKEFSFGGKTYPVTIKKQVASQIK